MKIVTLMVILLVALASCDSKPSDDKSGENFIYSSQSVSAMGLVNMQVINGMGHVAGCNSSTPPCYAIVFSGTVNNTQQTGIAFSDDIGDVNTYKITPTQNMVKIYYQGGFSTGAFPNATMVRISGGGRMPPSTGTCNITSITSTADGGYNVQGDFDGSAFQVIAVLTTL